MTSTATVPTNNNLRKTNTHHPPPPPPASATYSSTSQSAVAAATSRGGKTLDSAQLMSQSGSDHLYNGGGGGSLKLSKSLPPPPSLFDYGGGRVTFNGGNHGEEQEEEAEEDVDIDDPVATNWNDVSADPCSDLVRYDPMMRRKWQRGEAEQRQGTATTTTTTTVVGRVTRKKRVSQVYSDWNMRGDNIVVRPPIVFNGTFPIDKPISSRFVNGIPETIEEESSETGDGEDDDDLESSTSSSGGDGLRVDKRLKRGGGLRRRQFNYSRRSTMDGHNHSNGIRFRRRSRALKQDHR